MRIVFLTGRQELTRSKAERSVKAQRGGTDYGVLVMRPRGERCHAGAFQVEEIRKLRERCEVIAAR